MKLALAIVVCIGIYLCAATAPELSPPIITDAVSKAYRTALKIDDPKLKLSPETKQAYEEEDPELQLFIKNGEVFEVDCGTYSVEYGKIIQLNYLKIIEMSYLFAIRKDHDLVYSSWFIFKFADLDFKIKCIKAFEQIYGSGQKKGCLRLFNFGQPIENEYAFRAVLEGINKFIEDLKKTDIDEDAMNKLKLCTKNMVKPSIQDKKLLLPTEFFFEIFKFWFSPYLNQDAMNAEIIKMKNLHHLSEDKAAKVMVMLKKFEGGKINENYLPAKRDSIWVRNLN